MGSFLSDYNKLLMVGVGAFFIGTGMAIVLSTMMTLIGLYSGDRMILSMSHAVEADRKKYPHLVNAVEGLAIASGIVLRKNSKLILPYLLLTFLVFIYLYFYCFKYL